MSTPPAASGNDAPSYEPRDSRETRNRAQQGLMFLQVGFRRRDALAQRSGQMTVAPGSSLAGDRDAANYNPVPDQIRTALATALDHLHNLQVSVESSGGTLLAMSSFTLIRSAFESAGTGLWLLSPSSRDERILRSVKLTYDNRRQLHTLRTEMGDDDPRFSVVKSRLQGILLARARLADESLRKPESMAERLRNIAGLLPDLVFPPLSLWRMASGIAHGNQSMIINVLEQEQVTPVERGSADFKVTSSFVSVAMHYDAALNMVETLLDLYATRNHTLEQS